MPKNLVLFSDGTGNSAAKLNKTNVWRIYDAVDLSDPANLQNPRQFAFYSDGVGSSSFKPLALLGGAYGAGLTRNVRDLYVFLCRMYEPGDRIYAFGFSRGAFTIRVLIGLVMNQGLVRYNGSERDLLRLARGAYRAYRAERWTNRLPLVGLLRRARDAVIQRLDRAFNRTLYRDAPRIGLPGTPTEIKINFVGLFDTVDAYGLPVDELTRAIDSVIWPLTMRDYNLNSRVLCARHALAIDDERNAFHPRPWNEEPDPTNPGNLEFGVPGGNRDTTHIDQERISQVWFAGVHSNVGGGYPDDSLSYVPLQWMMREAQKHGLRLEQNVLAAQEALADENGPIYDSRRGLGGYYRYNPRRIEELTSLPKVTIKRTKVHESALRRIRAGHDGYAPITLPPAFAVMKVDGSIVDGDAHLEQMRLAQLPAADAARPPPDPAPGLSTPYREDRELVYNWVWGRRVVYFSTIFLSFALAAMPAFAPGSGACHGALCFTATPITVLGTVLPSWATTWTDSFASYPNISLPLGMALAIALMLGGMLQQRIGDHMRRVWYKFPMLKPPSAASASVSPTPPGPLATSIKSLRKHPGYRGFFKLLALWIVPAGFVAGLALAAVALCSQVIFAMNASRGAICSDTSAPMPDHGVFKLFDISNVCARVGLDARQGATYRVRITVPAEMQWWDRHLIASPNGYSCPGPIDAAYMAASVVIRRHPTEPWFLPVARIGVKGNDTYPLHGNLQITPPDGRCLVRKDSPASPPAQAGCPSDPVASDQPGHVFESELVARSSGPLFIYVNDAVGPPLLDDYFYKNNRGCARVSVTPLEPTGP